MWQFSISHLLSYTYIQHCSCYQCKANTICTLFQVNVSQPETHGTARHTLSISMMKIIVFFLFSKISTKIAQKIPTRYVKWLNIDHRRTNIEFWFYCCVSPCFRWQNLLSFVLFSFLFRATDKPTENSASALLRTNNKKSFLEQICAYYYYYHCRNRYDECRNKEYISKMRL